ncbi:MAG: C10 family peptidase, partial [Phycisphaerae bacterium]|nr:C10 family peptidase [Phycisphaerae bacterium]
MEKFRNIILVAMLMVIGLTIPLRAKKATVNDALTVANNWISLIIEKKGAWGDANNAYVEDIQEFKRGQRTLGYFCRVFPKGYIVLSLHKQLAPVKAYSATCNLDPDSQEGMTDLIKGRMERILGRVDEWARKLNAPPDDVMAKILEVNYRDAWNELQVDATSFQQKLESDIEPMNYQEGGILLSSSWHQLDPYNQQCPLSSGTCTDTRCAVGCVATAGA